MKDLLKQLAGFAVLFLVLWFLWCVLASVPH